jgi:hypothetical protein
MLFINGSFLINLSSYGFALSVTIVLSEQGKKKAEGSLDQPAWLYKKRASGSVMLDLIWKITSLSIRAFSLLEIFSK